MLIHVVDFSDENYIKNIEITNETLKEIGADNINMIYVYNKSDLKLSRLPIIEDKRIYMSASKKQGIKELVNIITKEIYSGYIKCKFLIPFNDGYVVTYLNDIGSVIETEYDEKGVILTLNLSEKDYNRYKMYEIES
ncbi:GTPase HflX [compost metagenome]